MKVNFTTFRTLAEQRGYTLFEDDRYPLNLNIVGWRNKNGRTNYFDDFLTVYWPYNKFTWVEYQWPCTTRPGIPWLTNPLNPKGTASLVPGQYKQAYALGTYKGYTALKQIRPVRVFRDNNRDSQLDENTATIEEGMFGLHIHRAGGWSRVVGVSSAGCQVFQRRMDFADFIDLCQRSVQFWGNSFTYTLVEF